MLRSFLALFLLQLLNCRPGNRKADPAEPVKLRLVNGGGPCAGRLEIYYSGQWGTVYDFLWDLRDAAVVCRELGCGAALSAPGGAHFGEGSGHFVTSHVRCGGTEAALRECASYPWGHHRWPHSRDAGVICSGHSGLRLVSGGSRCSGRVEVLHGAQWGTLCDGYFGLEDASVVCEHLQCGAVTATLGAAHFGEGTGPVWKENYRCRGNESRLWDCLVSSWDQFSCSHGNDASVICSDEGWPPRLTNGGSRCDGRVEIYDNGRWGGVRDKLWDINDANVVCRQLGCGSAIAAYNSSKYGESEGPVWVNDVECEGNEAQLRNCSSFTLKPFLTDSVGVGVLCSEHVQLRLSDGGSPCAGRVEVYYNGIWGSVCDDSWDRADANVVCRQLSCGNVLNVTLPASCGRGSDPVWLDELNCSGNESFLWECPSTGWGNHDCDHKEDVRLMCSEHKEMRLVKGKHRCEGRVEVFYNGTWGTVCSEKLDRHDAEVICKQLQCGPLLSIQYSTWTFGMGSGPIWLDQMECTSDESTLWQCQSDPWGQHNCHHGEDAGVVCSDTRVPERSHSSRVCVPESGSKHGHSPDSGQPLRLVGGNTNCSGRVEILSNNSWGKVCDDSWDMADANVVCRQLGCGPALLAAGEAAFAQGDGVISLDEVNCTGSESFLSDCRSSPPGQHDCDHKEDASVICSELDLVSADYPSTSAGQGGKTTSISVAICITLGILLIGELIALMAVSRRKSARRGAVTGGRESPAGLYQAIYEEIENIPPGEDSAQSHGSVSSSNDSLNHIDYYTSDIWGDADPGPEHLQRTSFSIQGPVWGDYDDAETGVTDTQGGHLLLDGGPDDVTLGSAGGDLSTLDLVNPRRGHVRNPGHSVTEGQ